MWNEHSCVVVWTFFAIFLWDWKENWPFPVFWSLLSFPNLLAYWVLHCNSIISFRIWNSSAGIPWPPLGLFIVMFPMAHLTSHSRMSGSRWVTTPLCLSRSLWSFLYSSPVYSCHLFLNCCRRPERESSYIQLCNNEGRQYEHQRLLLSKENQISS